MSSATLRGKITDEEILDWLVDGSLVVELQTPTVTYRGRVLKPTIVGRAGTNGTRYRVEFRNCGRKRTIILSKLVYMAGNMQLVPDGYEIHHVDGDRYNDAFANLVLVTQEDHQKIHGHFRYVARPRRCDEDAPF